MKKILFTILAVACLLPAGRIQADAWDVGAQPGFFGKAWNMMGKGAKGALYLGGAAAVICGGIWAYKKGTQVVNNVQARASLYNSGNKQAQPVQNPMQNVGNPFLKTPNIKGSYVLQQAHDAVDFAHWKPELETAYELTNLTPQDLESICSDNRFKLQWNLQPSDVAALSNQRLSKTILDTINAEIAYWFNKRDTLITQTSVHEQFDALCTQAGITAEEKQHLIKFESYKVSDAQMKKFHVALDNAVAELVSREQRELQQRDMAVKASSWRVVRFFKWGWNTLKQGLNTAVGGSCESDYAKEMIQCHKHADRLIGLKARLEAMPVEPVQPAQPTVEPQPQGVATPALQAENKRRTAEAAAADELTATRTRVLGTRTPSPERVPAFVPVTRTPVQPAAATAPTVPPAPGAPAVPARTATPARRGPPAGRGGRTAQTPPAPGR